MRTTPKIFALADGRTERVFHKQIKFQNMLKENRFCCMVETLKKRKSITSTALRLDTYRLVFSRSFFHIVGMDNRMIDVWDPST